MLTERPQTSIDPNNPHGFYTAMPDAAKTLGNVPLGTLQAIPGALGALLSPTANALGKFGSGMGQASSRLFGRQGYPGNGNSYQPPLNQAPPNFIQPS